MWESFESIGQAQLNAKKKRKSPNLNYYINVRKNEEIVEEFLK